jgi:hypothetical protein
MTETELSKLASLAETIADLSSGEIAPTVAKTDVEPLALITFRWVSFAGEFNDCLSYLTGIRHLLLVQHVKA